MSTVPFLPIKIGNLELKNRFLMSAAVDGMAADPHARAQRYSDLARGGVGLIVAGRVLDKKEEFGRVVDAVHEGGGRIALQILSHMGLGFNPKVDSPAASVVPGESVIFSSYFPYGPHHEATEGEIEEMIAACVNAARLAKSFGVDAVQVHSAHSSALLQFLTPLINQRKDKWGGPVENRVRVHQEVYRAVRAEVGPDMPILIKLGVEDPFPNGLKLAEGVVAARLLAECGYDAIEVSQGLQDFRDPKTMAGTPIRTGAIKVSEEGYFRAWCRDVKKAIDKPAIMTGGIRSYEIVAKILAGGEADMIGMCRPFVREPGLVKRWEEGDRKKATCISCNKCGMGMTKGLPLACYVKEK
ncbi:MAG: NADH:flavin oxidoreductase [Deltaproteobacteria bacterium]|nr:NADH:flavin oxidoreductase [Deltaproteobacteria bacterium]